MSNYTPSVSFEEEFEGDVIQIVHRRMKRVDVMKLTPYMSKIKKNMSDEDAAEVSNALVDTLPDYIDKFDGLKDSEGNPLTLEQAMEQNYFFPLVSRIGLKVMEASNPGKTELDKGKKPKDK